MLNNWNTVVDLKKKPVDVVKKTLCFPNGNTCIKNCLIYIQYCHLILFTLQTNWSCKYLKNIDKHYSYRTRTCMTSEMLSIKIVYINKWSQQREYNFVFLSFFSCCSVLKSPSYGCFADKFLENRIVQLRESLCLHHCRHVIQSKAKAEVLKFLKHFQSLIQKM